MQNSLVHNCFVSFFVILTNLHSTLIVLEDVNQRITNNDNPINMHILIYSYFQGILNGDSRITVACSDYQNKLFT